MLCYILIQFIEKNNNNIYFCLIKITFNLNSFFLNSLYLYTLNMHMQFDQLNTNLFLNVFA